MALASYAFFDLALSRFPLAVGVDWRSEFAVLTLILSVAVLAAATYTSTTLRGRTSPAQASAA